MIYNFSTWDIETTDWNKIEVIGYYNKNINGICYKVSDIINIMEKIGGDWFAHASGIFDNKFLLLELLNRYNVDDIKIKLIHNTIGHIEIKNKFILRDSYYLFPVSLREFAKSMINKDKMDIDRTKINSYSKNIIKNYVLSDCILLYESLVKANELNFNIKNLTLSQNTFQEWKKTITKNNFDNLCISKYYDSEFRLSYYGGRCEVFNRYGKDLNYYDVNSLYPYVMAKFDYPYGCPLYTEKYQKDYFGIYKVVVNIPLDTYLPPVPYRTKVNKLIFPVGSFTTYLTNIDIDLINDVGGNYKVINGFYFKYKNNLFSNYVNKWYNIKKNSIGAEKFIAKRYLNTLYGKMAQKRMYRAISFKMPNESELKDKEYTLLYHKNLSNNIVNVKEDDLQIWSYNEESKLPYTLLHLGLFITSYARMILFNLMNDILKNNGDIYYCDTDSIITNIKMPIGNDLGELKLVDKIKEGYFVLPKLYSYINYNNETIIKAKGCNINNLNYNDFKCLLIDNKKIRSVRTGLYGFLESIKTKQSDFISIKTLEREITDNYDKRIINSSNYDTNPLIL